jgi:inner membrane protein
METVAENIWSKSKLLIKALLIVALVLLLMIPTYYIQGLIQERESRQKEAVSEISSKWAGKQNIMGPLLVLPYWQPGSELLTSQVKTRHYAYFLPDEMKIRASVTPMEKYRGIYKVMLYASSLNLAGSFNGIHPEKINIAPEDIIWNEAFLQINIADLKGSNDEPVIKWNNQSLVFSQGTEMDKASDEAIVARINLTGPDDLKQVNFSADLHLNGSDQLLFTPSGRSTSVNLSSKWPHPSFTGEVLPQTTQVKDSGFTASWKTLELKRNLPRQWKDNGFTFFNPNSVASQASTSANATFGANLYMPVNDYQKVMRSVKYAVLCILLTFASFFLIEVNHKKSVHPFQYGLIGLALVLFYTLLLSFSEYTGFNISYVISSFVTIALIAWFVKGLLDSTKLGIMISLILVLLYSYVFTILQLQDYSLLLGSVGLFITLGVVMHFSKRIKW